MSDKLFFGEIESQGRKAVAEQARRRGTGKAKDGAVPKTPMGDEEDLSQKNANQAQGSY